MANQEGLLIIGGVDNPVRDGLVFIVVDGLSSPDLITALRSRGIRIHTLKADHYSGNILEPRGLSDAVRVSMCHYNSLDEVKTFLAAMREILGG
ncbi:MAG: aminotransferase class V-fold PLP-dependent enzyme [Bacteroidetes bacterium]|nr:aminotransferase class V-fold PLP-dependent enzyme [Bacteroidota bacterium]